MKTNRKKRRLATLAVCAVVAVGSSIATAGAASAASGDDGYVVAPACVYLGPSYLVQLLPPAATVGSCKRCDVPTVTAALLTHRRHSQGASFGTSLSRGEG